MLSKSLTVLEKVLVVDAINEYKRKYRLASYQKPKTKQDREEQTLIKSILKKLTYCNNNF